MISKTRQVTYRVAHRWDEKTKKRILLKEFLDKEKERLRRGKIVSRIIVAADPSSDPNIQSRYYRVKQACSEFISEFKGFNPEERYILYRRGSYLWLGW